MYASRWELLMDHRDLVDLVQIVTWNGEWLAIRSVHAKDGTTLLTVAILDYGESSYIGPIDGDQPQGVGQRLSPSRIPRYDVVLR